MAADEALIRAIQQQPYDSDVYAVYGDWLTDQGDPRGELIALQIAAERDPEKAPAAAAYLQANAAQLVGDLEAYVLLDADAFTWRYGFIHRARLFNFFDDALEVLAAHPSGRFVVDLSLGTAPPGAPRLERALATLQDWAPVTMHHLQLGQTAGDTRLAGAPLEDLWPSLPMLRRVDLDGGAYEIGAIEALPLLEHLSICTGGLSPANLVALTRRSLPSLRTLELVGEDRSRSAFRLLRTAPPAELSPAPLRDLLRAPAPPQLRHLAIRHCPFGDALVEALVESPWIAQLESLDLSHDGLGIEAARLLHRHERGFAHLGTLNVSHNPLPAGAIELVRGLAVRVVLP